MNGPSMISSLWGRCCIVLTLSLGMDPAILKNGVCNTIIYTYIHIYFLSSLLILLEYVLLYPYRFQVTLKTVPSQPLASETIQVMSVVHNTVYVIYDACRGDADKQTCVCQVPEFGNRIPTEEDRKKLACKLGTCPS